MVSLTCLNGRQVVGNSFSICYPNGWVPRILGSCLNGTDFASICPPFPVPAGGKIMYSPNGTNITRWTVAAIKCLNGQQVVGKLKATSPNPDL
ncbi:unnamed protein product [Strongylus vulgaris]|uniref:Sushi domain-containing protein n=1 Tax=Strongylus vulgaris TaxID=40348 RepID=A0A3P7HYL3_STRVU|nr:unnamed protein product [Strongylus vulgaris]